MSRNYSSISPSAKALLLTKGLTTIPFMADVVKLVYGQNTIENLINKPFDEIFLKRLLHFESRYLSLDSLLVASGSLNILEIAAGYSFRGLDLALKHPNIYYLDTDLPEVVETKNALINTLVKNDQLILKGKLVLQELNALDGNNFEKILNNMPVGPVSFINEGLLMYLNTEEKIELCKIIHRLLKKRGGYWITADIYIKNSNQRENTRDEFSRFLKTHDVENNKFDNFKEAEQFFLQQGFKLVKKATSVWHQLSSIKYIDEQLLKKWKEQNPTPKSIRETWALSAI